MQLRFSTSSNGQTKQLVRRSHVGHASTFHDYEKKIADNAELIKQAMTNTDKSTKQKTASGIVLLRRRINNSRKSSIHKNSNTLKTINRIYLSPSDSFTKNKTIV